MNINKLVDFLGLTEEKEGMEDIESNVEKFFFGKKGINEEGEKIHNVGGLWDRFPGKFKDTPDNKTLMNISKTDLDALTHYFGNVLSQQKYGTPLTFIGGLFNEARGLRRGNKVKGTLVDLINNMSGISPDILGNQEKYTNILSSLIQDPNFKVSDEDMVGLLQHGLGWTVDPPEREKYGQKK